MSPVKLCSPNLSLGVGVQARFSTLLQERDGLFAKTAAAGQQAEGLQAALERREGRLEDLRSQADAREAHCAALDAKCKVHACCTGPQLASEVWPFGCLPVTAVRWHWCHHVLSGSSWMSRKVESIWPML